MLMLLAGYETTGNSMIFLAYNLAVYKDTQEKLRKEVDEMIEKHVSQNIVTIANPSIFFVTGRLA